MTVGGLNLQCVGVVWLFGQGSKGGDGLSEPGRSPAESGAGCMVGSALVLRAAAGTATTGGGNWTKEEHRWLRCSSGPLRKRRPQLLVSVPLADRGVHGNVKLNG